MVWPLYYVHLYQVVAPFNSSFFEEINSKRSLKHSSDIFFLIHMPQHTVAEDLSASLSFHTPEVDGGYWSKSVVFFTWK